MKQLPVLHEWFIEHFIHPYATKEEIEKLANELGVSCLGLRNWLQKIRRNYWLPTVKHFLDGTAVAELEAVGNAEAVDAAESAPVELELDWAMCVLDKDGRAPIQGVLVNYFCGRPLSSALDDKCFRVRTLSQLAQVAGTDVGEMRAEVEVAIRAVCPAVSFFG